LCPRLLYGVVGGYSFCLAGRTKGVVRLAVEDAAQPLKVDGGRSMEEGLCADDILVSNSAFF
jgi:hypothetical protein